MAAPAFPDVMPSRASRGSNRARLRQARFGDGYTQSAADGLNHIEQSFEYVLQGAAGAECQTVLDFLEERAGYQPFMFRPYGFDAAVQWRCETWSEIEWISATHGNLRASFVRDFSP